MKTSRKEKRRLLFITSLIITAVVVLVSTTFNDWKQILENNREVIAMENSYENLVKEEKSLESDVTKLKDPEYVARYAKEKYMYSSDGEVIIRMD